ncbi:hypothetical protein JKF63_02737 [Porcisia hertigi]|uniref:Transmembrane protein 18 n=1 Tax=Porcisia hertigi TaxID=2761500 RepID=A0A836IJ42_9TRYP|nr:hypothetical protein JKF63_02737 [Porcisia hertigi]
MSILEGLQAWLERVEEELWRAHNDVMNATGARVFIDAATASSSAGFVSFAKGLLREVNKFLTAVNWSETFFVYLGVFHVAVWACAIAATWGAVSDERIFCVCMLIGALLLAGVSANGYAGRHAHLLFEEPGVNYFTEDGIMMTVVYFLPLLGLLVLLQLRLMYRVVSLMARAKRAQFRREMRAMAQRDGAPTSGDREDAAGRSKKSQ